LSPEQMHDPQDEMKLIIYRRIMCFMAAVWRMYVYQDYPALDPPVWAFKVRTGDQLDDFIRRGDVTDLQICYNQPKVLDGLKYTEFLERYNTSSKLPKFYEDNRALKDNVSSD
jgi:hypothetical protein